jgi:hypothetical protein
MVRDLDWRSPCWLQALPSAADERLVRTLAKAHRWALPSMGSPRAAGGGRFQRPAPSTAAVLRRSRRCPAHRAVEPWRVAAEEQQIGAAACPAGKHTATQDGVTGRGKHDRKASRPSGPKWRTCCPTSSTAPSRPARCSHRRSHRRCRWLPGDVRPRRTQGPHPTFTIGGTRLIVRP